MLETALRAKLPMIRVRTDDVLNVDRILTHLTGVESIRIYAHKFTNPQDMMPGHTLMWSDTAVAAEVASTWYEHFVAHGLTLIVVNAPQDEAFDAGIMPVPRALARAELGNVLHDHEAGPVLDALGGLSLKELKEVSILAMVEHGELTPASVTDIRRRLVTNTRGLYQVDTAVPFYWKDKQLDDWLAVNGEVWRRDLSVRLRPKGLLFKGGAGTGKGMAAKYLARELGVPLYRLDLGSIFQKWLGDSEENIRRALDEVDRAEPCILFIDEVEKVLRVDDDHATASRILGSLLWWMQERTTKVLTLLTTNDADKIPLEMIRPERLDCHVEFGPLRNEESIHLFVTRLIESMPDELPELQHRNAVKGDAMAALVGNPHLEAHHTPAEITQVVNDLVRRRLV